MNQSTTGRDAGRDATWNATWDMMRAAILDVTEEIARDATWNWNATWGMLRGVISDVASDVIEEIARDAIGDTVDRILS